MTILHKLTPDFLEYCADGMTIALSGVTAWSGCPSYNLSVSLPLDSSPSRGASGEEAKLYGMPKPPLVRSNNDDRRQWRKQGVAVGAAASKTQAKRCGCWVPQPGQWHGVSRDGEVIPPSPSHRSGTPLSYRSGSPLRRGPSRRPGAAGRGRAP